MIRERAEHRVWSLYGADVGVQVEIEVRQLCMCDLHESLSALKLCGVLEVLPDQSSIRYYEMVLDFVSRAEMHGGSKVGHS